MSMAIWDVNMRLKQTVERERHSIQCFETFSDDLKCSFVLEQLQNCSPVLWIWTKCNNHSRSSQLSFKYLYKLSSITMSAKLYTCEIICAPHDQVWNRVQEKFSKVLHSIFIYKLSKIIIAHNFEIVKPCAGIFVKNGCIEVPSLSSFFYASVTTQHLSCYLATFSSWLFFCIQLTKILLK